jgi:hypothetical protein
VSAYSIGEKGVEIQCTKVVSWGCIFCVGEVDLLQQVEDPRSGNGLGTALHVQFAADVGDMFFHGAQAQHQATSDLTIGRPGSQQLSTSCSRLVSGSNSERERNTLASSCQPKAESRVVT